MKPIAIFVFAACLAAAQAPESKPEDSIAERIAASADVAARDKIIAATDPLLLPAVVRSLYNLGLERSGKGDAAQAAALHQTGYDIAVRAGDEKGAAMQAVAL